ncbi:MAG: hypothetical protein Q9174_005163, partial [Haloplaca sp. 1 TL-2023]
MRRPSKRRVSTSANPSPSIGSRPHCGEVHELELAFSRLSLVPKTQTTKDVSSTARPATEPRPVLETSEEAVTSPPRSQCRNTVKTRSSRHPTTRKSASKISEALTTTTENLGEESVSPAYKEKRKQQMEEEMEQWVKKYYKRMNKKWSEYEKSILAMREGSPTQESQPQGEELVQAIMRGTLYPMDDLSASLERAVTVNWQLKRLGADLRNIQGMVRGMGEFIHQREGKHHQSIFFGRCPSLE